MSNDDQDRLLDALASEDSNNTTVGLRFGMTAFAIQHLRDRFAHLYHLRRQAAQKDITHQEHRMNILKFSAVLLIAFVGCKDDPPPSAPQEQKWKIVSLKGADVREGQTTVMSEFDPTIYDSLVLTTNYHSYGGALGVPFQYRFSYVEYSLPEHTFLRESTFVYWPDCQPDTVRVFHRSQFSQNIVWFIVVAETGSLDVCEWRIVGWK